MAEYFVFKRETSIHASNNPHDMLSNPMITMVPLSQALDEMKQSAMSDDSVLKCIDDLIDVVSLNFKLDRTELLGRKRDRHLVDLRYLLFKHVRDRYSLTFEEIGHILGGFDHATVMRACEQVEILKKNDQRFAAKHHEFQSLLAGGTL